MRTFLILLLFGGGLAFFLYARDRSLESCRGGALLIREASRPLPWLREAAEDRFYLPFLRQGPVAVALKEFRVRAALAAGEPLSWHLSPEAREKLKALVVSGPQEEEFRSALESVARLPAPADCRAETESAVPALLVSAGRFWDSRRTEVRMARLSFAHDRKVFCQADALSGRLKAVIRAAQARCASAKKKCNGKSLAPMRKELAEIERQKEFNREKLKRKWPPEILEELTCSHS